MRTFIVGFLSRILYAVKNFLRRFVKKLFFLLVYSATALVVAPATTSAFRVTSTINPLWIAGVLIALALLNLFLPTHTTHRGTFTRAILGVAILSVLCLAKLLFASTCGLTQGLCQPDDAQGTLFVVSALIATIALFWAPVIVRPKIDNDLPFFD